MTLESAGTTTDGAQFGTRCETWNRQRRRGEQGEQQNRWNTRRNRWKHSTLPPLRKSHACHAWKPVEASGSMLFAIKAAASQVILPLVFQLSSVQHLLQLSSAPSSASDVSPIVSSSTSLLTFPSLVTSTSLPSISGQHGQVIVVIIVDVSSDGSTDSSAGKRAG